jgi:sugar/nucleoside kinase (ribokinase family)
MAPPPTPADPASRPPPCWTAASAFRQICDHADLIFLNEAEYQALYRGCPHPSAPTVLKHGCAGAEFLADGARHQVPAPAVDEVDPIGAGEILADAFLRCAPGGLAEDRALSYAVAAATRSVTEFGVAGPGVTRELNRIREELTAGRRRGAGARTTVVR